jgi:hypothetical protein
MSVTNMGHIHTTGELKRRLTSDNIQELLGEYIEVLAETHEITTVLHQAICNEYAEHNQLRAIHINLTGVDIIKETDQLRSFLLTANVGEIYVPRHSCRDITQLLIKEYDEHSLSEYRNHNPYNHFFIIGLVYYNDVLYHSIIKTTSHPVQTNSAFDMIDIDPVNGNFNIEFDPYIFDLPEYNNPI